MDLGCLDLGCLEKKKTNNGSSSIDDSQRNNGDDESLMATAKFGKIKASKETAQSTLNAVNKSTLQIKKPPRKNPSPLNWFPRKKTDSYLKRKIRQLQEVGGMNLTLDETLGDSNPHYSRVLREKMAAKEAASKAMEARKAALVEASWCRILRAARIQSKEAESLLLEAEKNVDEAFEAAAALGVIMYDKPDCPQKPCEIASSVNVGGSTTHTVTASFETAFDVDKEVAAAVKTAFIRLANCPSAINKDECRELLRRISPDTGESRNELSELSSECESDAGSELESDSHGDGFVSEDVNHKIPDAGLKQRKCNDSRLPPIKSMKLVDMMLERLKCLQDDELASLATIVATCGLNAALLEVENSKLDPLGSAVASSRTFTSLEAGNMKYSNMEYFKDPHSRRKQGEIGVPSLDKVLVKHMSRLEREVQEAKNTQKNEPKDGSGEYSKGSDHRVDDSNNTSSNIVPDLGSTLVKHACKLERDIEEAKRSGKTFEKHYKQLGNAHDTSDIPSLDKLLVRHVSKLEREVQEAKNKVKDKAMGESEGIKEGSRNKLNKKTGSTLSEAAPDLGSILIKHSSKLEKEIAETKNKSANGLEIEFKQLGDKQHMSEVPSLDKFLVKHVSKLEREVQEAKSTRKTAPAESNNAVNSDSVLPSSKDIPNSNNMTSSSCMGEQVGKENIDSNKQAEGISDETVKEQLENEKIENQHTVAVVKQKESLKSKYMSRVERAKLETLAAFSSKDGNGTYSSLDSVMVKPVHRLEREKVQALALGRDYGQKKKEAIETSNCESLDKVLVKHVSRLEKEKMVSKEEDYGQKKKEAIETSDCESLDKVLVKHVSRLEKEKMVSKEEVMKVGRREPQYEKSHNSLDQVLVKHQSRLEKEKLAAAQQSGDQTNKHFEARREAKERELQQAWGGLSLGNSIRPSISRLEREKAAWIEAEEEERTQTATL